MVLSLDGLPDEILYNILCYCNPYSAVSLEQTARRFKHVTNEALLWRFYCQTYFDFWDSRHNIQRKLMQPVSAVNWKELYVTRCRVDHTVTQILDSILSSQTGRIEKFRAVVEFGYDVKDCLLRHSLAESSMEDHLARRFALLLECLIWAFLTCGRMACRSKDITPRRSWLVFIGAWECWSGQG